MPQRKGAADRNQCNVGRKIVSKNALVVVVVVVVATGQPGMPVQSKQLLLTVVHPGVTAQHAAS